MTPVVFVDPDLVYSVLATDQLAQKNFHFLAIVRRPHPVPCSLPVKDKAKSKAETCWKDRLL